MDEERIVGEQDLIVAKYQVYDAVELFDHFATFDEFFYGIVTFWIKIKKEKRYKDENAAVGGVTYRCIKY